MGANGLIEDERNGFATPATSWAACCAPLCDAGTPYMLLFCYWFTIEACCFHGNRTAIFNSVLIRKPWFLLPCGHFYLCKAAGSHFSKSFVWQTDTDGVGWWEENQQQKVGFVSSKGRCAGIIIWARCWTQLQTSNTYMWKIFRSIAPAINRFVTWDGFTIKRSNRLDTLL